MQQRRFATQFEDEAVRLALTSGRTQRAIAGDLGIGLSTLVRWIGWAGIARLWRLEGRRSRTWRPS